MKYYRINPLILFRHYGDFGYLTDNRNFGYNFINNEFTLGDEIISETGADIVSCIEKEPLSIEIIMEKVFKIFGQEDDIQCEVVGFLDLLSLKGFIISGESAEECANINPSNNFQRGEEHRLELVKGAETMIDTQAFLAKRFGNHPFPTSVHVEITSECNERCIHCYIPHEFKQDLMDEKLFYKILCQSRKMNLLHITISGGEPMLHPHFLDFLKECRKSDMSVNVLSNLTLLNDVIIEEMKQNPLLCVQTSIYSMQSDIHDSITHKKGSLNKTLSSVLKLVENHIPVQISCPILRKNSNSYKSVQEWAAANKISVGVDFSIIAKYNHNKENLDCRLTSEELTDILHRKIVSDSSYVEELKKEIAENKRKTDNDYICSICNSSICIGPNGDVFPCVGWSNKIVGNMQSQTLQDIWVNSEKVKSLREIRRKDFSECKSCDAKEYCTICMVRNANESPVGNPFELSRYFCDIAKIKKNIYENYNSMT